MAGSASVEPDCLSDVDGLSSDLPAAEANDEDEAAEAVGHEGGHTSSVSCDSICTMKGSSEAA